MTFDLHLTIPEDSPAGQIVQRLVAIEHVTPEQAVTRILTEAAKQESKKTPAEEIIGAFSSDEDSAITDEAMKYVREMRQTATLRDFGI